MDHDSEILDHRRELNILPSREDHRISLAHHLAIAMTTHRHTVRLLRRDREPKFHAHLVQEGQVVRQVLRVKCCGVSESLSRSCMYIVWQSLFYRYMVNVDLIFLV